MQPGRPTVGQSGENPGPGSVRRSVGAAVAWSWRSVRSALVCLPGAEGRRGPPASAARHQARCHHWFLAGAADGTWSDRRQTGGRLTWAVDFALSHTNVYRAISIADFG